MGFEVDSPGWDWTDSSVGQVHAQPAVLYGPLSTTKNTPEHRARNSPEHLGSTPKQSLKKKSPKVKLLCKTDESP